MNATVLVVTFWHIWESRNDLRNNGVLLHPRRVASKIVSYVDMINEFLVNPKGPNGRLGLSPPPKWKPPPELVVCVNVDAALFPPEQRMGWGAVFRNHAGEFLLSCSEGLHGLPPPELAEAIAVRRAMSVARVRGFSRIAVVSDCLSVIQRILASAMDRSTLGAVINDINTLKTDFQSCLFSFSSRKTNVLAHKLARAAQPLVCNISAVIPEFIRDELCTDVM
ncbi:hypothetical protein ACQ4PT_055376 [Festuca glaucescens]